MGKSIREVMNSKPCAIDGEKPVAYAAKMMKQEDVGLAPIVEGDRLIGTSPTATSSSGSWPRARTPRP